MKSFRGLGARSLVTAVTDCCFLNTASNISVGAMLALPTCTPHIIFVLVSATRFLCSPSLRPSDTLQHHINKSLCKNSPLYSRVFSFEYSPTPDDNRVTQNSDLKVSRSFRSKRSA